MSKLSKETIKGLVMEVLGERKAVVSEGRVTKSDLQRIIKEEYNAMVSEAEDESEFYAGGMEPFTQASKVPVATDVLQMRVDNFRKLPGPSAVNTLKGRINMSQNLLAKKVAKDKNIQKIYDGMIEKQTEAENLIITKRNLSPDVVEKYSQELLEMANNLAHELGISL